MTRRKDRYQPRAASASQPKTLKTYATVNDLKSQHAVEADGPRDGADALDHGGNAP